jgi:hypothetical protein
VMRIGRVQERDRDARVEDDYRHSLRSPARYPEGWTPVRRPAWRRSASDARTRRMRPGPAASTRNSSPDFRPARLSASTGIVA